MDGFAKTPIARIKGDPCHQPCAIERGMRLLGGKWTGSILWHLKEKPLRFNEIGRNVPGASKKMITERLRHLEETGLVTRTVLDTSPVAVEYALTAMGESALGFLHALNDWMQTLPGEEAA